MRIYSTAYELMSETGRNLYEMGLEVKPKTYQNKNIQDNPDFITKELICEQYCLTKLPDPEMLFLYNGGKYAKSWADEEFKERISGEVLNPGKAWELRREVWEEFLSSIQKFDYTYPERINRMRRFHQDSLTYLSAIIRLLREDSDTRKAVLSIFDPSLDANYLGGEKRMPCSMYYDFLIRENARGEKQLNICYHQRSSDFALHFGCDVYLAWNLMNYVAYQVGVKPGYLYHTIDSLHCYKRDWVKLKTSVGDIQHS